MTTNAGDARRKTRRWRGWLIAAVIAVALISLPVSITLVNDAAARHVEQELLELPLPAGAERLDSVAQAGKLSGNGNGMQYLGAILIRSDQGIPELESFYDAQATPDDLTISVAPGGSLDGLHKTPGFLGEEAAPGTVIVSAWGDGPGWFFEEFDLRGR